MSEALLKQVLDRLEGVTKRLESIEGKIGSGSGSGSDGPTGASVEEFDALKAEFLSAWLTNSGKRGTEVAEIAALFEDAVNALRATLVNATKSKKPDQAGMGAFLKPLSAAMMAVTDYRGSKRGSKDWDFLSTVSEGVACFGWVAVGTPVPFATQTRAGAEFYSNKLLVQSKKNSDADLAAWVNGFTGFLKGMEAYIKQNHRSGLEFTGTGDAAAAAAASAPPAKKSAPAPPPKPAAQLTTKSSASGAGAARGGLFAELNQGGKVTAGLKKVTRDMQTHKNKALRAGGVVKATAIKKVSKHRGIPTGTPKGPVLEGNKWVLEFIVDGGTIEVTPDIKHSLYVYGCVNTVVQVKSKINQVQLDSSKKVSLVLQDVLATVDVVNSGSVQVQVLGKSPTISIEKVSGAQVYLSKDGLDTEVITAKSDSVNLHVPTPAGEFAEHPIPEQFKSTVSADGKVETNFVDHSD